MAGTEPHETCDQQRGVAGLFSRFFGGGPKILPPPNPANAQDPQNADQKKKGFFGKLTGIFKDDKSSTPPPKPPDTTPPAPQ